MSAGKTRSRHVSVPFRDTPSKVLAVTCSDGRYIDAVEQYLADVGHPHHDLVAIPGGPANLLSLSAPIAEYQVASEAVDFMLGAHRTTILVLIAHQDCAFYLKRYGASDPRRQKADLVTAAEEIQGRHRQLRLALCYVSPDPEAGGIKVEMVPRSGNVALKE